MHLVWQSVGVSITGFKEKCNSGGQGHALEDSFVGLQGIWVGPRAKAEWYAKYLGRSEIIHGKLRSPRCKESHTAYVHLGQPPRLLYCNTPAEIG